MRPFQIVAFGWPGSVLSTLKGLSFENIAVPAISHEYAEKGNMMGTVQYPFFSAMDQYRNGYRFVIAGLMGSSLTWAYHR